MQIGLLGEKFRGGVGSALNSCLLRWCCIGVLLGQWVRAPPAPSSCVSLPHRVVGLRGVLVSVLLSFSSLGSGVVVHDLSKGQGI